MKILIGKPLAAYLKTVGDASKALLDLIKPETDKIDAAIIDGLSGASNSLGYKVEEIEKHLHNREKWFGVAAVTNGEIHVADRMAGGISPFVLTAGNDDFGSWVQILGSSDTPVVAGNTKFDAHRFLVTATNSTNPYIIQIAGGESADLAALVAAEAFTEAPYIAATNNNDSGISDVMSSRVAAGTKVWARCACIGGNGTTLNAYIGLHEYAG